MTNTLRSAIEACLDDYSISVGERTWQYYTYLSRRLLMAATVLKIDTVPLDTISYEDGKRLVHVLSDKRYFPRMSQPTVAKNVKFLKCIFARFTAKGLIPNNPIKDLTIKRTKSIPIQPFQPGDVLAILSKEPTTPLDFRDLAIWHTALDTGLRCFELCRLRLTDFDGETIYVRTAKCDEHRPVSLGKTTRDLLGQYLREFRVKGSDFLFVTADGNPMTTRNISKRLQVWSHKVGVRHASMHQFRVTFATQYYKTTRDSLGLQTLLGHSTLDMTRHYIHLSQQQDACLSNQTHSIVDGILETPAPASPDSTSAQTTQQVLEPGPGQSKHSETETMMAMMQSMLVLMQQYMQTNQQTGTS